MSIILFPLYRAFPRKSVSQIAFKSYSFGFAFSGIKPKENIDNQARGFHNCYLDLEV